MDNQPAPTRLKSLVLIPLGGALLGYTLYTLRSDGSYYPKLMVLGIVLVGMGALGGVDPRLLNPWHSEFAEDPRIGAIKVVTVLLWLGLFGVAFYPMIALHQGWWLPEALVSLIRS